MSLLGIRSKAKSMVKSLLGIEEETKNSVDWTPPMQPEKNNSPEKQEADNEQKETAEISIKDEIEATDEVKEGGLPLTLENLEEVLDDFVRPGLQADGGDITLVKLDGKDVYVELTGACSTCSSSVMTMKMGVEALLREEFPTMNELIDVTHG